MPITSTPITSTLIAPLVRKAGLVAAVLALLAGVFASTAAAKPGAVVFSKVVTKTDKQVVTDKEGNPVKDKDGKTEYKETTTIEGGLFAVRDHHLNQLTEDPSDTEPAFSPDGRTIAFVRGDDIYSVRPDGSGQRHLTSGGELDSTPLIAPNGRYLVFERRDGAGAAADLYTVGVLGGGLHRVTNSPEDDHDATFSPDGKAIAFVRSSVVGGDTLDDIYSVRPSGAKLARLTRTANVDEFEPRYFSGGILFSRGERSESPSAYADIYTMRRNGKKMRPLVRGVGSAYVEDVSAAGHLLLFRRDQGLWVKKIGPKKARKLTQLPDGSETSAVFSSDGRKAAAFIEAGSREQLSSIDVRTGSATELAEGFVPSETSETGGTTTSLGPVIAWQPSPKAGR
jgi:dipeptidyl aminopeptidase/acylaminoacyl peptidase